MVDLILHDEYFGYHEENWKLNSASGISEGKSSGSVMAEGIGGVMVVDKSWRATGERDKYSAPSASATWTGISVRAAHPSRAASGRPSRVANAGHGRRDRAGGAV